MALQMGPYYVLPDVGSHGRIKTYIQVLGQWLLKKLEAAFLKQHAGKVKIPGMLFFMPASACCCRFDYWGKTRPPRCLAGKNKR